MHLRVIAVALAAAAAGLLYLLAFGAERQSATPGARTATTGSRESPDVSVQRIAVDAGERPDSADPRELTGEVLFLDAGTRTAVANVAWLASEIPSARSVSIVSDQNGRAALPLGAWRLCSVDAPYDVEERAWRVESERATIVLVRALATLRLRICDGAGAAIEGANCSVTPFDSSNGMQPIEHTTTDSSGRATFSARPFAPCVVAILAPQFERALIELSTPPDEVLEVRLSRCWSDATRLHVVDAASGEPVEGVRVVSALDGTLVAQAAEDTNQLLLPAWVRRDEPLRASAAGFLPNLFEIEKLERDELPMERELEFEITVLDERSPSAAHASVVIARDDHSHEARQVRVEVGRATTITLPCAPPVRIEAQLDDGRSAGLHLDGFAAERALELRIRAATPAVELVLLDGASNMTSVARGEVLDQSGARLPLRPDVQGRLWLPARASSFELQAPSYALVRGSPFGPREQRQSAQQLVVQLSPQSRSALFLSTPAGDPLQGVNVGVFVQPAPRQSAPSSGWIVGPQRSSRGVSDGNGLVELSGLPAGRASVRVWMDGQPSGSRQVGTLYAPAPIEAVELGRDAVELTFEAPRALRLEVLDAARGALVEGFTARDPRTNVDIEVRGGVWSGWIGAEAPLLVVGSPRLGYRNVPLPTDSSFVRVELGARAAGVLEVLRGEELESLREVEILVWSRGPGGESQIGRTRAQLDAVGRAETSLDAPDGALISIECAPSDGRRVSFEPRLVAWSTSSVMQFRARVE